MSWELCKRGGYHGARPNENRITDWIHI